MAMLTGLFGAALLGAVAAAATPLGTVRETPKAPRNIAQEEANRAVVMKFATAPDVETAMKLIADDYKQHNPTVADGKAGVVAFFTDMKKRFPDTSLRVYKTAADGDLVWLHGHLKMSPEDPGFSLVDIFRVRDGKLVEHWDIMQPIPKESANTNSMF